MGSRARRETSVWWTCSKVGANSSSITSCSAPARTAGRARAARCSMFVDQIGHLAHLHARDVSLALISIAPLAKIEAYRKRMGWSIPWVSASASDFNRDFGMTTDEREKHGLSVFIRDDRERDLSHLLHNRARRRGAGQRVDASRPDAVRPAGNVGKTARGLAADAALCLGRRHDEYLPEIAD